MTAKIQQQDGKVKWVNSKCAFLTKNCRESMENHLNSSGIFSQDFRPCRFLRKFKMFCKSGALNLKNSQTGSSSCQCSTTSIGQEKKTMEVVFRTQKVKEDAKRFSQGHWTFLGPGDEQKWYGTPSYTALQRYWSSSNQEYQSSSRGILKQKNNRDTIHFNADAPNTELLFRIVHSVNQLRIHGAVSNWCEQFGLTEEEKGQEKQKESVTKGVLTSVKLQEVKLIMVSSPRPTSGNSLRGNI